MTSPLPTAPSAASVGFEEWVAQVATADLKKQIQLANRQITALYVLLAGSLDNQLPQNLRRAFADGVVQILNQVQYTGQAELQQLVNQGLNLGAQEAAMSGAVTAVTSTTPEVDSWTATLVGTITGRLLAIMASAKAAPHIGTLPLTAKDMNDILALAYRAISVLERDARWATNAAVNQGVLMSVNAAGVPRVWVNEWGACLHCLAYAGEVAQPYQPYPSRLTFYVDPSGRLKPITNDVIWGPPLHPNCVPAGTVVSGPPVELGYSRRYTGELVELRTQTGHVLSVTPNHPILTAHGWVPAGEIHPGADVISHGGGPEPVGRPDEDQKPTPIEQVLGALRVASRMASRCVAMTPEDLHGDGTDGEVEIVAASGFLEDWSQVTNPLQQRLFVGAGRAGFGFSGGGATGERSFGPGPAGNACAAGHRIPHSLFRGFAVSHQLVGSGVTAQAHPGFGQNAGDRGAGDGVLASQVLDALSGQVVCDQVIEVRRFPFDGQVYNLQTRDGWYSANGIVTQNCRCRQEPYLGSLDYPVMPWETRETTVADALKREAKRQVLQGRSGSDSLPARVRAASDLLSVGAGLPKTVEARARASVRAGQF